MTWHASRLGDVLTLKRGHDLPDFQRQDGDVPVVSSSGITGHHIEYKAKAPGVVTGRYGTIGQVFYVEQDYWPLNTALYVTDFKGNHPRFVAYFLESVLRNYQSDKAAVPGVNRNVLHDLKVHCPDTKAQERISNILSAYDDLIENNQRRIALLEEGAGQLYCEWFVRLRFPGHEHIRVTDGVPEGWNSVRFEEVLMELESGGRPRGGATEGDGIPSIGAENVLGLGQYDYTKEKFVPEAYFERMTRGVVRNRDVVLYKDGANVGRSSYFGEGFPHPKCAVNEHVFILRTQPFLGQSFLYFWMVRDENRQAIANLNANTAQPGISQEKLKGLPFLLPNDRLTRAFNEAVESQIKQVFTLALMNQKLSHARDLLLPRLMSGHMAV